MGVSVDPLVEIETRATTASSDPSPEVTPASPSSSTSPVSQSLPVALPFPEMEAAMNRHDADRIVSWQARKEFEADPIYSAWHRELEGLMRDGRWKWREAAYILWASMPNPRIPKTERAFAQEVLGLTSARQIRRWKSDREKGARLQRAIKRQTLQLLSHARADVVKALVVSASAEDYRNFRDRELFLKLTGDYVPKSTVEVGPVTEANAGTQSEAALREEADIPGLTPADGGSDG